MTRALKSRDGTIVTHGNAGELLAEKPKGTVGRSDYSDVSGGVAKTVTSADVFRSGVSTWGWNFSGTSTTTVTPFAGGQTLSAAAGALTLQDDSEGTSGRQVGYDGASYVSNGYVDPGINDFSLAAWVYVSDWSTAVSKPIMARFNGTNGWIFYINSANQLLFETRPPARNQFANAFVTAALSTGWHHFVLTREAGVDHVAYVDAVKVSNGIVDTDVIVSSGAFEAGSFNSGAAKLTGRIDEVLVQKDTVWDIHQIRRLYYSSELSSHHGGAGHTLTASSFDRTITGNQISFWNLEADGNDDSVNTNDLTNVGSTPFTGTNFDGSVGAADFTRASSQVLYATGANFDDKGSFTAGCWAKLTTEGTTEMLVSKWGASAEHYGWYLGHANAGSEITFRFAYSVSADVTMAVSDALYTDNKFHFFVCQYDQPNSTVSIFIDGVSVIRETNPLYATRNNPSTSSEFTVGGIWGGAASTEFQGPISNAFYAKYSMTDAEIQKLYSMKAPHSVTTQIDNQLLLGQYTDANGIKRQFNTETRITGKDNTDVYTTLDELDAEDKVSVRMR